MYRRSFPKLVWYRIIQWVFGLLARVWFRLQCRGMANVPAEGPVLLVSNHQSHLDPVLIGCFVHRPLGYLARATLFKGLMEPLIRALDAIPIDREGMGLGGIRATLKRIKKGDAVLLFPEGTRTKDGELQPLMPGFIALARRGKASVVPIAISGAFEAMPRGRLVPRPVRITLECGEPIPPEVIAELDDDAIVAEVARRLAKCLAGANHLAGR